MSTALEVIIDQNSASAPSATALQTDLSAQELLEMQYQLSVSPFPKPPGPISAAFNDVILNLSTTEDRLAYMLSQLTQQDRGSASVTYITNSMTSATAPQPLAQTAADPLLSLHPFARPPASSPF